MTKSPARNRRRNQAPPIWLGVLAIILVLAIVAYVIALEFGSGKEGFHSGPNRYLSGFWYDHYPYPPHSYFYDQYPPPNPYLYPGAYHSRYHYYGPYGRLYYDGRPRYIPYDPLDPRLPLPIDGHTQSYYYDRYQRLAESNKANNPYQYHYDAEGELIPSEKALYYDHQPWNQPTPRTSWWSGWLW